MAWVIARVLAWIVARVVAWRTVMITWASTVIARPPPLTLTLPLTVVATGITAGRPAIGLSGVARVARVGAATTRIGR